MTLSAAALQYRADELAAESDALNTKVRLLCEDVREFLAAAVDGSLLTKGETK